VPASCFTGTSFADVKIGNYSVPMLIDPGSTPQLSALADRAMQPMRPTLVFAYVISIAAYGVPKPGTQAGKNAATMETS
jgi:hypothetical protein